MAHWTASSYFSTGEDPLSYFFVVRYLLHGGDHLHNSGQEEIEKHNKQTKKKIRLIKYGFNPYILSYN
jgi:hypothetical protein